MRLIFALMGLLAIAACAPLTGTNYSIGQGQDSDVQYRMLDGVNALRQSAGVPQVQLNSQLNAAAETHARDMHIQQRPWHFGSDGSSPVARLQRVGYSGTLVGENISESYETELETLAAWMQDPATRDVIVSAQARQMGFAWYREDSGKTWWTLVMAQ